MSDRDRGILCLFCGQSWGYVGEHASDALITEVKAHEFTCPANPYTAKIAALESENARLREALGQSTPQLVYLVYYHNGFTDCYPVLVAICTSRSVADAVIEKHKTTRDKTVEYLNEASWWVDERFVLSALEVKGTL